MVSIKMYKNTKKIKNQKYKNTKNQKQKIQKSKNFIRRKRMKIIFSI